MKGGGRNNMMMRRRMFMSKIQRDDCPYQRVEYLEVGEESGEICSRTKDELELSMDVDCYCSFLWNGYSTDFSYLLLFAQKGDNNVNYCLSRYATSTDRVIVSWGNNNYGYTHYIQQGIKYEISILPKEGKAKFNDSVLAIPSVGKSQSGTFQIFPLTLNQVYARFYYLRLVKNNKIILDLIPVRIGNVGYIYDKVKGELLDNLGDGHYILGPDIGKPYDCEVEYLESSGGTTGPIIRTDYIPNVQDIDIEYEWMPLGYRTDDLWVSYFTAYTDEQKRTYRVIRDVNSVTGAVRIYNGSRASGGGIVVNTRLNEVNKLIMYGSTREYNLNGINGTLSDYLSITGTDNIGAVQTSKYTEQRIYHLKFTENGKDALDLIPVRKGNVGYLYDKVSGRLFGNIGEEGSYFKIGPDIAPPYDAKVEYLGVNTTGKNAYIDTGYIPVGNDIDIYADLFHNGYSATGGNTLWFGNSTYGVMKNNYATDGIQIRLNSTADYFQVYSSIVAGTRYKFELLHTHTLKINDSSQSASSFGSATTENTSTIKIFNPSSIYMLGRIYSFKVVKAGELVLDLIPVRKDGKGYMYNKVDGKLYGNANEGDGSYFIIGPDIN